MKGFLVTGPHCCGLADMPVPSIGNEEVLLRVGGCGICGSDVDIIEGTRPREVTAYPVVLGHEFSGLVVEVGAAARTVKPGDKVAVDTLVGCKTCRNCQRGWTSHCLTAFDQLGCTKPGGMAEYAAVPERLVYKMPDHMDPVEIALAEPASCAAHGVSKAQIRPGDSVVIVGAGPIGALALQTSRLFSPATLILIEIDARKLELGRQLGATHVIDATKQDVTQAVMDITRGLGANAIIECTGRLQPIQQASSYVGTKGRIVVIGVPPETKFEINFLRLLSQDAVFRPSNGYTTDIWLWVLDLLANGFYDANTILTHRLHLHEVERAFDILRERSECAIKVIISPNQG